VYRQSEIARHGPSPSLEDQLGGIHMLHQKESKLTVTLTVTVCESEPLVAVTGTV